MIPILRQFYKSMHQYFVLSVPCSNQSLTQSVLIVQAVLLLLWIGDYIRADIRLITIPAACTVCFLLLLDLFIVLWIAVVAIFLRRTEKDLIFRAGVYVTSSVLLHGSLLSAIVLLRRPNEARLCLLVACVSAAVHVLVVAVCRDHAAVLYALIMQAFGSRW